MRQVILDTETTGLRVEDGHRIIEVACIELIDRKITGRQFHQYINPNREVEAGALAVHGISNTFLADKPLFTDIVNELLAFINGAELIIHNAPFDLSFLDAEFKLANMGLKATLDYCTVLDTLVLARKIHVGQRNSLDALCKRYFVDNSKREFHGALLDCYLLAQVYLAMTGGQGSFFDELAPEPVEMTASENVAAREAALEKYHLVVLKADDAELSEHANYLELLKKRGKCLWND